MASVGGNLKNVIYTKSCCLCVCLLIKDLCTLCGAGQVCTDWRRRYDIITMFIIIISISMFYCFPHMIHVKDDH